MSSLQQWSINDPRNNGQEIKVLLPFSPRPRPQKKASKLHLVSLVAVILTNAFFATQIYTFIF